MGIVAQQNSLPYLGYAFFSYLLLGVTDTVHHLHAALAMGQSTAMHAAVLGLVFVPLAVASVALYSRNGRSYLFWSFIAIAILAIAVPGIYHGGWNHLVKVMAYLRIDGPSTQLGLLFPADDINLWFYEVTGMLEFVFAVVAAYFIWKLLANKLATS